MQPSDSLWAKPEFIAPAIAIAVAVLGGLATEIGPWYKALKTPSWKPPDWAYGPVWTIIFALTTIAAINLWRQTEYSAGARAAILIAFGANCVLNVAWSWLFFKQKRPDWALIESVFLWLSVVGMLIVAYPLSSFAAWLLLPYLIWVTIASVLNWTLVRMNGPFHPPERY